VLKIGADGFETGEIVDSSETVIEWATPDLILTARAPKSAALGGEAPIVIALRNAGKAASPGVTLRLTLPDGVELVRSEPEGRPQSQSVSWQFPPLAAGRTAEATATVRPKKSGMVELTASAETSDGMRAEKPVAFSVDPASWDVAFTAPANASLDSPTKVTVSVTNTGSGSILGTTAWLTLPDGVEADGGNPVEIPLGTVTAGNVKRGDAMLRFTKPGRTRLTATVTADGGLNRKTEATVEARRSEAKLAVVGPERVKLGQSGLWELKVQNSGDAPLTNGTLRVMIPRGLSATNAGEGGRIVAADVAEWSVGELRPGAAKTFRLSALTEEMVQAATLRAVYRTNELAEPLAQTATVTVEGEPALVVDITDPPARFPVGQSGNVRVRIRNSGRGPARGVELTFVTTPGVTVLGGTGPDRRRIGPTATDRIQFDRIDELKPGETLAFIVELAANAPGLARLNAEVRAAHLTQPTRDEQTTQITP
jgi:hypothetical protein